MRLQLALNVPDLPAAVDYYERLFGVSAHRREPGYANFEVANPPLKLVLFESAEVVDRLNHLGVEYLDDESVVAAQQRLLDEGLAANPTAEEESCCYSRQLKAKSFAPDGTFWEFYRVLEPSPERAAASGFCCT